MMMAKKSLYLLLGLMLLAGIVSYSGYRVFFIERDFIVHSTIACDPRVESCFVWCEEGTCDEDYYKKISKNARNIPVCNGAIEECMPVVCEPGEAECDVISCSSDSVEAGEQCTNMTDFFIESEDIDPTRAGIEIESSVTSE